MTRQLPFEVAPTVNYHTIGDEASGQGVLKFRVKKALSIGERIEGNEVDRSDEIFQRTGELCKRIAAEAKAPSPLAGQELNVLYGTIRELLSKMQAGTMPPLEPLEAELAICYTDEILALSKEQVENGEALLVRQATVMIRHRLNGCQDWTDEDTIALESEQLIVQIALLFRSEAMGGRDLEAIDAAKQLEALKEALGKLQLEHGSLIPDPTGPSSTGSADPTTPEKESSAASDSQTTPSRKSSPRSRQPKIKNSDGFTTKASESLS